MPSDHSRFHGPVPVRAALIVAEAPEQSGAVPVTVAVGKGLTVMTAEPEEVPVQVASDTVVTVYVVDTPGFTVRVAGEDATPFC
jgi:hypothetical protein